jgi:myosin light chain 6
MVNSVANTSTVSINSQDESLAQCREVFLYFDTKGDEKISVSQVGDVLRAMGQNPTQAEINKCCEHWTNPSELLFCLIFLYIFIGLDTRVTFEDFVPIYQTVSFTNLTLAL